MKKHLCSFTNKAMSKGFLRLQRQAEDLNIFDKTHYYTEAKLDVDFKKKFKKYLIPFSRGFGYWCWKPQIILQTLDKMNNGDILLYMDLGSHLNVKGRERLQEYFILTDKSETGILAFRSPEHIDKTLTKMDVFKYFGVEDNKQYTDTTQIEAGHLFIKKNDFTVSFINEWLNVIYDDFSLITDSPSKEKDFEEFKNHRHDQSIFSILAKKYNITTLSTDETYSTDWSTMLDFPLLAKRDKVYNNKFYKKHQRELGSIYQRLWKLLYGK